MALDAATLALTAAELKTELIDAKIDKIFQPTRDEVLLSLRTRQAGYRLLLSARSGSARVCLTEEKYENPQTPPSFCMLLRKHLSGGRLVDMRVVPGERIVFFDWLCTNEMGDLVNNTLAVELMGRYCNLVLYRREEENPLAGKIIDALKRVDFEASEVRQLLPGLAYTLPPQPVSLYFGTAPFSAVEEKLAVSASSIANVLKKTLGGVGPVIIREIGHRAGVDLDKPGNQLSIDEMRKMQKAIEAMQADYADGGHPNLAQKPDGTPTEFSFTRLTQYEPSFTIVEYDQFSPMLEGYYAQKDRLERLRQKSKELRKTVQNLYDRTVRKQAARLEDLAASEQSDHLRVKGELLTANLHAFNKGDTSVTLANWYDDGNLVTIPLEERLSPSANAQRYFKEYKKKQTAARMLADLLESGKKEIAYLETVLYEVDTAQGEAELGEIRAELKSQGYLKYYKQRDKRQSLARQKSADFFRYRSSDGFLILAGRNNAQNEKLTLKTARGKDLWFHTKNAPGSHVVVMSEGKDIPLPTQNEAAMLAVWHSGQKNSSKVPVDYTEVKNIRKTSDLPLGMVLYDHYQTAYVTPDTAVIDELEARGET